MWLACKKYEEYRISALKISSFLFSCVKSSDTTTIFRLRKGLQEN